MALITSDCDAMRIYAHQMTLTHLGLCALQAGAPLFTSVNPEVFRRRTHKVSAHSPCAWACCGGKVCPHLRAIITIIIIIINNISIHQQHVF